MQAGLGLDTARRLSVTHDEFWHLPVGLLNLRDRRFDYDVKNPPLTRVWSALPLALGHARIEGLAPTTDAEVYGAAFLEADPSRYTAWFTLGRAMNLFWLAATGLVLAVWGRELFGATAALGTLLLWACCPNVLAHGALVTPDAGLACLTTATLFAVWRHSQQGSWRWTAATGVLLGLALAAKFTALILIPLIPCAWAIARLRSEPPPLAGGKLVCQVALAALLALAVLDAAYLFQGTGARLGDQRFISRALSGIERAPSWLKATPLPVPGAYVQGVDFQRRIMEGKPPAFLDGEWREGGFAGYYLLALAYKLPHAVQALLLLALWAAFRPAGRSSRRALAFLLLPVVALVGAASLSTLHLGVRYILPAFPLLLLVAGSALVAVDASKRRVTSALAVLALLVSPLSLRAHPQHLAYFNEAAGGCRGGREHLLDSNLDWGQSLYALQEYVAKNPDGNLKLAYFGTLPPSAVGLRLPPPPAFRPQPGRYAVSVNFVGAYPSFLRLPDGSKRAVYRGQFGYFRFFEPRKTLGCSIDVFELTREDVRRWEALGAPARR